MKRERRAIRPGAIRAVGDGKTFEAVVLVYNVIDSYNTRFRAGCFSESLAERLPRITWGHDWRDVLGRYVDYRDTDTELTLIGEFDDFDAVPRARQAAAQLLSGTIDQFSVGFERLADEMVDPDEVDGARGVVDITKGTLDEAALVLAGAVPGTHLVSIRSQRGPIDLDAVVEIAKKKAAGELTDTEAQAAVDLLAGVEPQASETPPPDGEQPPPGAGEEESPESGEKPPEETEPPPAVDLLDDSIAEALALVERSR
jgi:HK97 family phage prohead protease